MLERLEQVRVDRERAAVRLGGGQLDERADRVRVPVDLELEARLAVALDQRSASPGAGSRPTCSLRRAAQRALDPAARRPARAAPSATSCVNGSQRRSPALLGDRGSSSSGSSPAIPSSTNQPAPARRAAVTRPTQPLTARAEPLRRRPARPRAPGSARARPARTAAVASARGAHHSFACQSKRRPGIARTASTMSARYGNANTTDVVPVGVAAQLDVVDRVGCAHPPTVASASGGPARAARSWPQCAGAGRGRRGGGRRACGR